MVAQLCVHTINTEFYSLGGWTSWYVDYSSIKLLLNLKIPQGVSKKREGGPGLNCWGTVFSRNLIEKEKTAKDTEQDRPVK